MKHYYVDTSAALKLIIAEAESIALVGWWLNNEENELISSRLIETELRRAVQRYPSATQDDVTKLLAAIDIIELDAIILRHAGLLPGANLRSLDAIHIASALSIPVAGIVAYDSRLLTAAANVGLSTVSPA